MKPKEGDIYWTELPKDSIKLSGDKPHPVIINNNNNDNTTDVIGCTSKYKAELGDVKVECNPNMRYTTYARVIDGNRTVNTNTLRKDNNNSSCTNLNEVRSKLK